MRRVNLVRLAVTQCEDRLSPATFTVTSPYTDGDTGSLRWAVAQARTNPGPDVIEVPSAVLTKGLLTLDSDITLRGIFSEGVAPITQTTTGSGVFHIPAGVTVTLTDLRVSGGNTWAQGAGIHNEGNLTLNRVEVSSNSVTSALIPSRLAILTPFALQGGGIANSGMLTVRDSTIAENTVYAGHNAALQGGRGGGLFNTGTATLTNTTLFSNRVTGAGGRYADGGGLATRDGGAVTMRSCTVAFNLLLADTAGGAFGPGLYNSVGSAGRLDIGSTISAINRAITNDRPGVPQPMDVTGAVVSAGYNMIQYTASAFTALGDQTGVDPRLDNPFPGPDGRRTVAPASDSPAVDAGDPTERLTTDARGLPRPSGSRADIGAVEYQYPNTSPTISDVPNQAVSFGGTVGPLAFTVSDPQSSPSVLTVTATSSDTLLFPTGNIILGGTGANRTITLTPANGRFGTATITLTVSDGSLNTSNTFTVNVSPQAVQQQSRSEVPQPPTDNRRVAFGAYAGALPTVSQLFADGTLIREILAYDSGFLGGVRVAVGDLNGDGLPDMVTGPGPGMPTLLRAFDGGTGNLLWERLAFESNFTGGVYLAIGELTGDGSVDLVVTPDQGGGPVVKLLRGDSGADQGAFFGIEDPAFRGGARATVGDVNGDSRLDLIVGAGFGGGPRVAIFDGRSLLAGGTPPKLRGDFFVFEASVRDGVYLTGGDLDGDGFEEVIVGGGPGGGPRVRGLSGWQLLAGGTVDDAAFLDFFAFDPNTRGGVLLACSDLNGDGRMDILATPGTGGLSQAFDGRTQTPIGMAGASGGSAAASRTPPTGSLGRLPSASTPNPAPAPPTSQSTSTTVATPSPASDPAADAIFNNSAVIANVKGRYTGSAPGEYFNHDTMQKTSTVLEVTFEITDMRAVDPTRDPAKASTPPAYNFSGTVSVRGGGQSFQAAVSGQYFMQRFPTVLREQVGFIEWDATNMPVGDLAYSRFTEWEGAKLGGTQARFVNAGFVFSIEPRMWNGEVAFRDSFNPRLTLTRGV
jgi:hypothetical protein